MFQCILWFLMVGRLHIDHLLPAAWPVVKDVKVNFKTTKPQSKQASSAEVEHLLSSEESEDECHLQEPTSPE